MLAASMHSISGGPQGMVEDYELQGFEEANANSRGMTAINPAYRALTRPMSLKRWKMKRCYRTFWLASQNPRHESFGIGGVWISPAGLWIELGHGLVTFGDSVSHTLQAGPCDTAACCDVLRVERLKVCTSLIRYVTRVRKVAASVTVSFPFHYLLCKASPATSMWLVFMPWKHGKPIRWTPKTNTLIW